MSTMKLYRYVLQALAMAALIISAVLGARAAAVETFTATATMKNAGGGNTTAPIEIAIDRFVTDADRDKLAVVLKANDHAKTLQALTAMPDIGTITVRDRKTPIKYAYARTTGGGRLVTVVTAKPIAFVGAEAPNAKSKQGHDLALALLVLDDHGAGTGELALAVNVKVDDKGAIVTDDYSREVIRLTGVARKK